MEEDISFSDLYITLSEVSAGSTWPNAGDIDHPGDLRAARRAEILNRNASEVAMIAVPAVIAARPLSANDVAGQAAERQVADQSERGTTLLIVSAFCLLLELWLLRSLRIRGMLSWVYFIFLCKNISNLISVK